MTAEAEKKKDRRPDLSALRMDPERLEERHGLGWVGWLLILAVAAGVGYVVLRFVPPPKFLLPEVEVTTVQVVTPAEASTILTATGYTYARQRAAVGAKIIGRVLELKVDEGDAVTRGQLIAVLDSADLEAAVAEAEAAVLEAQARLADATREAARQERLVNSGVVAQAEFDAASTQRDVAEAQLATARARRASARAQLAYTVIRSPIDGVVIERNVEVGEMVAPGGFTSQQSTGSIVRIADPASLEVEADINESYIARLELGQPATIRVDAVPDKTYRGRLRQIVPTADRQRAVVQVKVSIEDSDPRLVPDMSSTVTFLQEEASETQLTAKPTLLVPKEAVLAQNGQTSVLLVDEEGVVETRPVVLGEARDAQQVIEEGLVGGERIVRKDPAKVESGQRVRVKE